MKNMISITSVEVHLIGKNRLGNIGAGLEGAAHSAVRRNALAEGITPEEIRHVAVLAITTLGFPEAMHALAWIGDYLDQE